MQRIVILGAAVVFALAILIPAVGYWREVLAKGDQPIAVVHGKPISTALYARYLGYQQLKLQRELTRLSTAQTQGGSSQPSADSDAQKAAAGRQTAIQFLQQRAGTLPTQAVDELIEARLIADEAGSRGISVSPGELDAAVQQEMSEYHIGSYGISAITGQKPELPSLDTARAELTGLLASKQFLSTEEHRSLVLEARVLRTKLADSLAFGTTTSGEQVHARHILVETEEQAKAVRTRLDKGEDFAALSTEVSIDTSNKDKGGDLGWFPRGAMVAEFEQAAFALKAGEISQPVKTSFGFHIIGVDERADNRPYSEDYVAGTRQQLLGNWLTAQQSIQGSVQVLSSTDKLAWANDFVNGQMANPK